MKKTSFVYRMKYSDKKQNKVITIKQQIYNRYVGKDELTVESNYNRCICLIINAGHYQYVDFHGKLLRSKTV